MPVDPFSFDPPSSLLGRAASHVAWPLFTRLTGLEALHTVYSALQGNPEEPFGRRVLTELSIETVVDPSSLRQIPGRGALIVAANHPTGALDGLVLMDVLRSVRSDVRLLANHLLARIPELASSCFFVDPFEGPKAAARSLSGLRAAHGWLRGGGTLIMFPSGEVAHERGTGGVPTDRAWSATLGRLASATGATVIPAFIDAANSRWFYAAGRLHPLLRTLLLPRELLRANGRRVAVRFGRTIDAGPDAATRARRAVECLSRPESPCAAEISRLSADAQLIDAGRFAVYCAAAGEIPATLHEIGRLRAITYRAAGEGTGAEIDLDGFDRDYLHLFVWDREESCVVGAYRLGTTDRIVPKRGVEGLYTRTLFEYGAELIDALAPALELGRSFVRAEYQRDYLPLLLLWRGIGRFIVKNPRYRYLFGPVSISGTYSPASHACITDFLERHHFDRRLARLVRPRHPRPGFPGSRPGPASSTVEADRLVAGIEADGKGLPVLIRQYLKLNARALAFSVDPAFGHVTDALMVVDLAAVTPGVLRRYLGDDGMSIYQAAQVAPGLSPAA
jgi:putative hemolysin